MNKNHNDNDFLNWKSEKSILPDIKDGKKLKLT